MLSSELHAWIHMRIVFFLQRWNTIHGKPQVPPIKFVVWKPELPHFCVSFYTMQDAKKSSFKKSEELIYPYENIELLTTSLCASLLVPVCDRLSAIRVLIAI